MANNPRVQEALTIVELTPDEIEELIQVLQDHGYRARIAIDVVDGGVKADAGSGWCRALGRLI